jgi:hypothetical protein
MGRERKIEIGEGEGGGVEGERGEKRTSEGRR